MTTLGVMNARIQDEINRIDLSAQINLAVKSAIHHYEPERFWYNEQRATANTVADQEYYVLPSDFLECDQMMVTVNSNKYDLIPRTQEYINSIYVTSTQHTGQPVDFSIYDLQLRLYPIPDQVYEMEMHYQRSFDELTPNASNKWVTDGERLIRSRAKWDIYLNLIHDIEQADRMKNQEQEEVLKMRERTGKFNTGFGIRSYI